MAASERVFVRCREHSGQRMPTGVGVMQSGQIGRPQDEQLTPVSRDGVAVAGCVAGSAEVLMLSWIDGSSRTSDDRRVGGMVVGRRPAGARPGGRDDRPLVGAALPPSGSAVTRTLSPARRSAGTSTEARPSAVVRKSASVGLGAVSPLRRIHTW